MDSQITGEYDFLSLLNLNSRYTKFLNTTFDSSYSGHIKQFPGKYDLKNGPSLLEVATSEDVQVEEFGTFDKSAWKEYVKFGADGPLVGYEEDVIGPKPVRKPIVKQPNDAEKPKISLKINLKRYD
ncbi:hypothetical protein O9G_006387 [Rozella allomycis CSF55]|uniref:Uncharacterized protein n=1 Tax=Rozella allomycis (strain CSF55) TaxID=988480 RepID=A0A075ANH3_ROZAC|nr:hypothetical protein O9G_006387 [Rozella allomycis CSF55]|eukprot:EPZ31369.1 hypothetical protein O9G_006387 [Rozella allomycis CSF55]